MTEHVNGNGELTREILRKEIKLGLAEQTLALRKEMDDRFKPVNEHIARVDRGELTFAQKAAIIGVMDSVKDKKATSRSRIVPIAALFVSFATLIAMVAFTLASGGYTL